MRKRAATYSFSLIALVIITVLLCGIYASMAGAKAEKTPAGPTAAPRADIVIIGRNAAESFAEREKPGAVFLHDQHTAALAEAARDCSLCHDINDKGKYEFVMKGTPGKTGNGRKDAFHQACVSCHQSRASEGLSAGPADLSACASCHVERLPYASNLKQVRMPQIIHSVHADSKLIPPLKADEKDNCAVCHHSVIDQDGKTPVLERGKEQACFTCHLENKSGDTPKLEVASHQNCLSCHVGRALQGKDSGPTNCAVCHAVPLATEKKAEDLPRLERGQPDRLFILPAAAPGETLPATQMPPALFNHKAHEKAADQCSSCHHARIDSCSKCHTLAGSPQGNFVNLYQASHTQGGMAVSRMQKDAASPSIWGPGRTCASCHLESARKRTECAGCHSRSSLKPSKESCAVCHIEVTSAGNIPVSNSELASLTKSGMNMLMNRAERTRLNRQIKVNLDEIPDVVNIGALAKDYDPAKFPHGKVVKALLNPARADQLAQTFHSGDLRACQGCHHNSAASFTPPSCASCHARDFLPGRAPERPALQQAYHQQCMGCHDAMNILKPANTDCQGCHAKRNG